MSSVFVFVLLGMLLRRPRLANADYLLLSAIRLLDKKEVIRIITARSVDEREPWYHRGGQIIFASGKEI